MENFENQISFPAIKDLDLSKVDKLLSDILQNKSVPRRSKSDARKLMALIRNIKREFPQPPMLLVFMAIASFPIGRKISDKIIFYSSHCEFYKPMPSGYIRNNFMDIDDLENGLTDLTIGDSACFSPNIRRIAMRKNIKLPCTRSSQPFNGSSCKLLIRPEVPIS